MSENIVQIDELPEVFDVLSSDKLYVFQENADGNYVPRLIDFSALSVFFHNKDTSSSLRQKFNELTKLSGDFFNWLDKNYATSAYISKNYSTIDYFNQVFSGVKADSSFDYYLEEYATKEYGDAKLAEAKAEYEKLKLDNTVEYGDSIIGSIDMNDDDDEALDHEQ